MVYYFTISICLLRLLEKSSFKCVYLILIFKTENSLSCVKTILEVITPRVMPINDALPTMDN